jgi:hypothetical protein
MHSGVFATVGVRGFAGPAREFRSLRGEHMSLSRRKFIQYAASASTLAVAGSANAELVGSVEGGTGYPVDSDAHESKFQANLLPTEKEIWDWQIWMANLGPKFTGNKAHHTFVDFLEKQLTSAGLHVSRDNVRFPLWEARRSAINVTPNEGAPFEGPVTSAVPYSGQTPASGVTADLVYAGWAPAFDLRNVKGKIVFVDAPVRGRNWAQWYPHIWGTNPPDMVFPCAVHPCRAGIGNGQGPGQQVAVADIDSFHEAGAVGAIIGWTDVSDANAAHQYVGGGQLANIPSLWVGRETGARLRRLALGKGAKVTLTLEADLDQNASTDHLIAPLPGMTDDEIIIVNSHTDGTNATEENGGLAVVALARYFSQIPKNQRRRTMMFVLQTGHISHGYVRSIRDVLERHPDFVRRAAAALTIEHLGCQEWQDDTSFNFKYTGQNEIAIAYAPLKAHGEIMVEAFQGSAATRTAIVQSSAIGDTGESSGLYAAGIPTLGMIVMPDYLWSAPPNGHIDKLDSGLMYSQIQAFAKIAHRLNNMTMS